ncbi:hypothetical protein [Lentzea sp. E54]|uniref:hypothetical protein n=1 Tax=Lentzea xerophila TaxID=3435883 RepID=UPI003DA2F071
MGVRRWFAAVLSAAVVVPALAAVPAGATGSAPAWRLASIPRVEATSNLWDVTAVDARNAWAAGIEGYHPGQPDAGGPLLLKWNGIRWSRAPIPAVPGRVSFERVAASSASDVWLLSKSRSQGGDDIVTSVWRYDGVAWTEVPYPVGSTPGGVTIRDMSLVDGRVWLVGYSGSRAVFHEWTGQEWREHQPPAECVMGGFPNFCTVNAVRAFAADDVWAAGNGWWNGHIGPVLFHWDGTSWSAVPVGGTGQALSLQSIDGTSSRDIWAVGDTGGMGSGTLVVRGDGTTWQVLTSPSAPDLAGVAVGASGAPWVIGNLPPSPGTAFETYRAGAWVSTPAPAPAGTSGASYNAITAVPGTDRMIAVGDADVPDTSPLLVQAVIAQYGSRR